MQHDLRHDIKLRYYEQRGLSLRRGHLALQLVAVSGQLHRCGQYLLGVPDGIYGIGQPPPAITGNVITGNTVWGNNPLVIDGNGGGIWFDTGTSPTITGNTISNNMCHGIYCLQCVAAVISGNTITGNYVVADVGNDSDEHDSDDVGGGIGIYGTSPASCTVTISHNIIGGSSENLGNVASYEGGGIYCAYATVTIDSNLIENNACGYTFPNCQSPAATMGGGLTLRNCNAGCLVTNNVFAYNLTNGAAGDLQGGGAIYAYESAPAIVNNTFVCNSSAEGSPLIPKAYGGAIQIDNHTSPATSATILNNIFYDNVALKGNSAASTNGATGTVADRDAYPIPGGIYVQ